MPLHALGPGQDHVVVGEHRAGGGIAELLAVDPRGARDQAVGRGPLEQLLLLTPGPLRRDREPAVLDEAALVDQVGEVLARRPQAVPVPLGDRLRARLVGQEPLAGAKLGELRAHALVAGLARFAAHQAVILFRPGGNGA